MDKNKNILWLSMFEMGHTHDFKMFKNAFHDKDFSQLNVWIDLGFLGIAKCIKAKQIFIPHKKKKNQKLSEEQKNENCTISRFRVGIENTIAMIKRFFILRIENRMHCKEKLDLAVELCACAWNFYKKYK